MLYLHRRFNVVTPTLYFPLHFEVIEHYAAPPEDGHDMLRLRNKLETYWVSRERFDANFGTVFVERPADAIKDKATAAQR